MNGIFSSRGALQVSLTHMEGRLYLSGARVEILGRAERGTTDKNGVCRFSLPTPPLSLSLYPNSAERPYSVYDIRVTMDGYIPLTVIGIQVFPSTVTIYRYDMVRTDDDLQTREKRVTIPPHGLRLARAGARGFGTGEGDTQGESDLNRRGLSDGSGSGPGSGITSGIFAEKGRFGAAANPKERAVGVFARGASVPAQTTAQTRQVYIPGSITVHLGTPGEDAVNVTIPFVDYIKSVASSEIYPTWPDAALRANIIAQITLALNRIYTEWYPSQGYDFQIASSPSFDQFYVYERDIFAPIDILVDEIFDNYIAREGDIEPIFASYCDGATVRCNGLSQWGTVTLANENYDPLEILRYYYGRDIEIRIAPIETDPEESYPGTPLSLGDEGENVRTIQNRLDRIAIDYPAIPLIILPDGIFNANTENAVRTFQGIFGLPQTGQVDEDTWYRIIYIYTAVKNLAELESEGERIQSEEYPGTPVRLGDTGPNVLRMQWYINAIAASRQLDLNRIVLDGIFGGETQAAVRVIQRDFGLPQTGEIDKNTWDEIVRLYNELGVLEREEVREEGALPPELREYPGTPIRRGARGESVSYIQNLINVIARSESSIPSLEVDGIFGPLTQAAVEAFQRFSGIATDGIVGPITWVALNERYIEAEESLPPRG